MKKIELIDNFKDIQQTVALPCYKGKEIGWLAMESLCNQEGISWNWELIICEEIHGQMLGKEFFEKYIHRLKETGCNRVLYIELVDWVPLAKKWQIIGKEASLGSKSFLLQAIDCYSSKHRLFISHHTIKAGYDWMDFTKGYFYSFPLNKLIMYDFEGMRNLSMAFKTCLAKVIPDSDKNKGVDSFLYRSFEAIKSPMIVQHISFLYEDTLDTDGFNNITNREDYYNNIKLPFVEVNKTIEDTKLPDYIKRRILNDKKEVSVLIPAYNSQEYIEECLESVDNQIYFRDNDKFEILIGVDGCQDTLDKVLFLKGTGRFRNLRIFKMPENKGTYMTLNSLLEESRYDNLVIFGSDDVMKENMVEVLASKKGDLIRPRFDLLHNSKISKSYSSGVIWVNKKVFEIAGGFQPWTIAADGDLIKRVQEFVEVKLIPDRLFYYRKHSESMTNQYSAKSELRIQMHQLSDKGIKEGTIKIERFCNAISNEY